MIMAPHITPTQCIYAFYMILTKSNHYFHIYHSLMGLSKITQYYCVWLNLCNRGLSEYYVHVGYECHHQTTWCQAMP